MRIINCNQKNCISIRISIKILCLLLIFSFILPIVPSVTATTQDAEFDSVTVEAIPPIQGIGGDLEIVATANFFGGCCYHLYARDVKAELEVPDNIRITSPMPSIISEVDAVPGGRATSVKFKWVLIGDKAGIYNLRIIISTSNCGTEHAALQVIIEEGVSIMNPDIHPEKPSVNEKITFIVEISSSIETVDIEQTTLYIWRSTTDYSKKDLIAERGRLFRIIDIGQEIKIILNDTNVSDQNLTPEVPTKKKFIANGKDYPMEKIQLTDKWRLQLDDVNEEEIIYYWFNTKSSDGENKTSNYVYKIKIEDYPKKFETVNIFIWSTFFIAVIGVILILSIGWLVFARAYNKIDKSGIYVLGAKTYSKPSEGSRTNLSKISLKIQKYQLLFFIIFFILAIILIIYSIYLGLLDDYISITGG